MERIYGKVVCPKCQSEVDAVDGEYARHYVIANVICTMSRRQVDPHEEQPSDDEERGDPALD